MPEGQYPHILTLTGIAPKPPAIETLLVQAMDLRFWNWDQAGEPYWRVYWNDRRGGRVESRDPTAHVTPDRLVLIAPHTPTRLRLENPVGHLFMNFVVAPTFHHPQPKVWQIPLAPEETASIRGLFECLLKEAAGPTEALQPLTWIARALTAVPAQDWKEFPMDPRINQALRLIDRNLSEELNVTTMAKTCAMSVSAFSRLFRDQTGQSPHRYRLERRLQLARQLLAETPLPIEEIAFQCGFCDRFHFTPAFSRRYGMAPATFRRETLRRESGQSTGNHPPQR